MRTARVTALVLILIAPTSFGCSAPTPAPRPPGDTGDAGHGLPTDAAATPESVKAILDTAAADLAEGRTREAELVLRDLVRRWPERADVHHAWMEASGSTGGPQARLVEVRRWLETHPECPVSWRQLAQCLLDPDLPPAQRDAAQARQAARRACALTPNPSPEQLVTLGTACYVSGDLEGAVHSYSHALQASRAGPSRLDCETELAAWLETVRAELEAR